MKALSLWQPWASAIALGLKRIETRSWATSYRGPIAIHAAKREPTTDELDELMLMFEYPGGGVWDEESTRLVYEPEFPPGCIVATANLIACTPTHYLMEERRLAMHEGRKDILSDRELCWGNYEPGRFGWVLEDIKALAGPIPYRGAQGLFDVPDSLFEMRGGLDLGEPSGSREVNLFG